MLPCHRPPAPRSEHRATRGLLVLLAGLAVCLPLSAPAAAHDGLDVQIAQLSQRIEADPADASLRVRRAELHRLMREWEPAFSDLHAAARLQPELAQVDLHLAHLLHDLGWHPAALQTIERFLERRPEDIDGRKLLTRVLEASGALERAAAEHDRRIEIIREQGGRPQPDDYFARAAVDARLGESGLDVALAGIDEGLTTLGPVPSLTLKAIELEVQAGNHDAALARLDQLAEGSKRQETWLSRRGDILASAGRHDEALRAYRKALAALAGLRPRHRQTAAMRDLEDHIERQLAELTTAPAADPADP